MEMTELENKNLMKNMINKLAYKTSSRFSDVNQLLKSLKVKQ